MRQVAGLISTYSSDEFGICSALYELGGMVVMHDASGCNSTYTTHDEPRWYDIDSMIFISAISEMEAIMGDDDKLIQDLIETAGELKPAFIAIVGAPIPYMIGTDLPAIAAVVERETGIPSFGFPANGMHDYVKGISMALESIVERFCIRDIPKSEEVSVNIIGATPLDFSLNGSVDSMKEWMREHDMEMAVCLSMGNTLEEIKKAGQAHVNLVVSCGGLAAARKLQELFGMPYVVGVPFGKEFADSLADIVKRSAETGECLIGYREVGRETPDETTDCASDAAQQHADGCAEQKKPLAVVGESVYSASLAAAIELETGIPVRMLCPLDTETELLRDNDRMTPEEDDLMEELPKAAGIIADPLYRPLCTEEMEFYDLPHEAFSGRIYDAVNPNLIGRRLSNMIKKTCSSNDR